MRYWLPLGKAPGPWALLGALVSLAPLGHARPANMARISRARVPAPKARTPSEETVAILTLGLRTGFGLPWGGYARTRATEGFEESVHDISKDTHGVVPVWVDLGYRLTPALTLGIYGMYAGVVAKEAKSEAPLEGGCPSGLDCFAYGVRIGLQAQYSFLPGASFNPWLGLAVGYEWMGVTLQGDGLGFPIDWKHSFSGPQWLQLQAGVDKRIGKALSVGPFLDVSAMQYRNCTANLGGPELDCEISQAAWHGWLVVGFRGSFHL